MAPIIAAAPWIIPAVTAAASIGTTTWQSDVAGRRAEHAKEESQQLYDKYSKPDPSVLAAQAKENRGQLGQARLGAYQNLGNTMAGRGWGSGSGIGTEGASNIESGYLRGLAQSQSDLTKLANTRQFGMPESAYGSSVPGGLESGLGAIGGTLNNTLGMYMANQALYNKGIFGGGGGGSGGPNPYQQMMWNNYNWPGYGNPATYNIGGP